MATTWTEFYKELQEKLGLDDSYLETYIPAGVKRMGKKFMRDYNFIKQVRTEEYTALAAGS